LSTPNTPPTAPELVGFLDLVTRMRTHQKKFFRTRDTTLIAECRDHERRVDDAEKVLRGRLTPSLFANPPAADAPDRLREIVEDLARAPFAFAPGDDDPWGVHANLASLIDRARAIVGPPAAAIAGRLPEGGVS
jgi:hypothetical protein